MEWDIKRASWLRAPDKSEAPPIFRKQFTITGSPVEGELQATAMGIYEIHLNGARVGEEYYAPGWTMYQKRLQYQSYDVTPYLRQGENTLDITVARGWCCGKIGFEDRSRIWAQQPELLAALTVTDDQGVRQSLGTDEHWSVGRGPVCASEFFDGETYDARIQPGDFTAPVKSGRGSDMLIAQEGEPVRVTQVLPACAVIKTPKGETVLDFGQNISGFVEFQVDARPGDVVEFTHGEVLDAQGNFYRENYRNARTRITYICKGGGETYHPRFAFQGFRYIRLDKWPGRMENLADARCFRAMALHSDMKRIGDFSCSDERVNRLFQNILWGQRGNFLDVPTDCPQRSERLGWTGDAQVFTRAASYNYDVERFFRKWLKDLAACQFPDGGVPRAAPDILNDKICAAGWSDAAVICPWQIYLTYGNAQVLEDQFESMRGWIEYLRAQGSEECLWDTGVQYGDWLGLDAPCTWNVPISNADFTGATHPYLIATAYYAYSTGLFVKAGRALGRDMADYEDLYRRIRKRFQETYVKDGALLSDTQTGWALALYFGLLPDPAAGAARLAQLVEAADNHLTTGFMGTPYLLHALSDNGYGEVAYTLLLQEEYPSWLYTVKQGATTIWECWDGIRPDGSLRPKNMNSFNHYAFGAVADWMYQTAAGIQPVERAPGFQHVRFAPLSDSRLDYCHASIDSRFGKVSGGWTRVGEKIIYQVDIPAGCTATAVIHGKTEEIGSGLHRYEVEVENEGGGEAQKEFCFQKTAR